MTLFQIAEQRHQSQQLSGTKCKTAAEMVSWFGAVQAQEYAQTKWSLGLRMPHLNHQDIEKEFTEGRLLSTHLLRPTWHFVTADDIRWLLQLTAPRVHAANLFMYRKLELNQRFSITALKLFIKHYAVRNNLRGKRLTKSLKKLRS